MPDADGVTVGARTARGRGAHGQSAEGHTPHHGSTVTRTLASGRALGVHDASAAAVPGWAHATIGPAGLDPPSPRAPATGTPRTHVKWEPEDT